MYWIRALRAVPSHMWLVYAATVMLVFVANSVAFSRLTRTNGCACAGCNDSAEPEIRRPSISELSFISVPRPLTKASQYQRMKLAIGSWLACSPQSRVLLFIDRGSFDPTGRFPAELDREFGTGRVSYLGGIRGDREGVPYIDAWFRAGVRRSASRYVCFINSDILLSAGWLARVREVFGALGDRNPILIGQRVDFDLKGAAYAGLRFTQGALLGDVDAMVRAARHSNHSPYGIDTFTFRADRPPFDPEMIPPFVMGRYNWDNWLVGWFNRVCETVTFNLDPPVYHMNHNRHRFDTNDSRVAINHHLKKANGDFFGSNYDTRWQVVRGELVQRRGSERFTLGTGKGTLAQ